MAIVSQRIGVEFALRLVGPLGRIFIFSSVFTSYAVWSQTVPSDLVDVSIEDLFAANVVAEETRGSDQRKWYLA